MLLESTAKVWHILSPKPELSGFILIGGTALAMHLDHRISEDLDFVWPHGKLPRAALEKLIKTEPALVFVLDQDEFALRDADDAGLELGDYSQTYLANGVRVTFFSPGESERKLLGGRRNAPLRIATVEEIFVLKSLVAADRSKTRDWFDLFVLLSSNGFTWAHFYRVFSQYSNLEQYENAARRLCSGRPQANDEGYESLLQQPPSVEEMRDYFSGLREAHEKAGSSKP